MAISIDDETQAPKRAGAEVPSRPRAGLTVVTRAREALAGACVRCPEADGPLRREMLCRCPVALAQRLLHHVDRHGVGEEPLTARERAGLDFQERALARRLPPIDLHAVRRCMTVLHDDSHGSCESAECLRCRARRTLEALVEADPA